MFKCKFCDKEYDSKSQLGGHTVYCISNPNKRKTLNDTYYSSPKKCKQCDTIIPFEKCENDFCKRSCSATFNNNIRDWKPDSHFKETVSNKLTLIAKENYKLKPKKCIVCGSNLPYKNRKEKFCSKECYDKKIVSNCSVCGSNLPYDKRKRKTCSDECLNLKLKEGGKIGGRKSAEVQAESRRSKNETLFAEKCISQFDTVLTNEPIFNGWDADIIIEDIKVAVLWNGKWHYEKITEKHSVKQVQNRDKIKIEEIKKSGYIPYVIKDMGKFNETKVQKEFDKFLKYIAGWTSG